MTDTIVNHEAIWELIPWYVNASLPRSEADAVERHRDICQQCKEEIERQLALAASLCLQDPFEQPRDRSWRTLRARIEAEGGTAADEDMTAARNGVGLQQRIESQQTNGPSADGWQDSWSGYTLGLRRDFVFAGTLGAALLVAVLISGSDQGQEWLYALTASPVQSGSFITFETASGMDREAIEQVLHDHQLTLTDDVSGGITYRAAVPKGLNVEEMADRLMATPEITLAFPEEPVD